MASGLSWKRNEDEVLDRRRRFFRRQMLDGILAVLPVAADEADAWQTFRDKWRWEQYQEARERPFPSNEEIVDRLEIGLQQRGKVEDDWLPVTYSVLDTGDDFVRGLFGGDLRFFHRSGPAYSAGEPVLRDFADVDRLEFSLDSPWSQWAIDFLDYFEQRADGVHNTENAETDPDHDDLERA